MLEASLDGPIGAMLREVWDSVRGIDAGMVADYIPDLAKASPQTFGLALATIDGAIYEIGDSVPFTIQSVSKPFVYALALADSGSDAVLSRVGAEPTGDPFNTISLDDVSGRAYNPMVNAGAIVTATLVAGTSREEQFARIRNGLSAFAGRQLGVDEEVFASERDTGDRNRAIAYLMRSAGLLAEDVEQQVAMYFKQCSIIVTARDLAVMAATLANAGINPVTGEEVIPREVVAPVLTVMSTCGMYDYAGEWLYRVGLPAKSGVSGGIAAALPGQLGLAAHSPPLDPRGNSVRGVAACEQLSARLGLHLLLPSDRSRSGLQRSTGADVRHSRRSRVAAQRQVLESSGRAISIHELVGDQSFATVEQLVRTVLAERGTTRWVIVDMRRVTHLDTAAATLLAGLTETLADAGIDVVLVEPAAGKARAASVALVTAPRRFSDPDGALEWCETELLRDHGFSDDVAESLISLPEQDLLADLSDTALMELQKRVATRVYTAGTVVFDEGDEPDGLYFVGAGLVSADIRVRGQRLRRRLSTIGAGSAFGELALIDRNPRSTRIVAVEPTLCYVLPAEGFIDLQVTAPESCAELTLAIARSLSLRLRYSTAEVTAMEETA